MKKEILSALLITFFVFSMNKVIFAQEKTCPNSFVQTEMATARKILSAKGFKEIKTGSRDFYSANEYRETLNLTTNKTYYFVFKTEKLVDQASLSLLNSYNVVVHSVFRETGEYRYSVLMEYTPNFSGEYTMVLKTVDYAGHNICGSWSIFEK